MLKMLRNLVLRAQMGLTKMMKSEETLYITPEERERVYKEGVYKKFYAIDVKVGDMVKYHPTNGAVFYGLVTEVDIDESTHVRKSRGTVVWSTGEPNDQKWHSFNSRDWSVLSR